jgi:F-box/leucine-rich repeat protein 2/20
MEDLSPTTIMNLPNDCLLSIFQRFDCRCDRESFSLTCHRWLYIQNSSVQSLQFKPSLRQLNLSSSSHSQPTLNIESFESFRLYKLLTRFRHLQSLSLSGCKGIRDLCLTRLEHCGSNLQSLCLDSCFGITDRGLFLVATCCPNLEVISLFKCNISDTGLEALANASSALKDVNLSYCALVSDHGLKVLAQGCRQLRAVRMSYCQKISGVGFRGCSSTLAYMEAECCKLEAEGIKGILSGGGLEYLNVSLPIPSHQNQIDGGLAAIGTGFASSLKILNFRMCKSVGDECIAAIAKGCPLLQEWNLASCHAVSISGWKAIGLNCNNLKKLHVNDCRNLCDRGLLALRDGCKRLAILYVNRGFRRISTAIQLFKCRPEVDVKEEEIIYIGSGSPAIFENCPSIFFEILTIHFHPTATTTLPVQINIKQ